MIESYKAKGIPWPVFKNEEMRDMVSYLIYISQEEEK